jgi:hypothetical protein
MLLFYQVATRLSLTTFTHVKISHLVASLPTSRQQVAFALLVPSCQQVWNKLLTARKNLVDLIELVARLFQSSPIQSWYNNIVTTLYCQLCNILVIHIMTVSDLLEQPCNKSDNLSSLLEVVNNLFQTCYNNWEQAVRTQPVDSLWTHL